MNDQERFCCNCDMPKPIKEMIKGVEFFKLECFDGEIKDPHDCCALHGFPKESEQCED